MSQASIIATSVSFLVLAALTVVLRIYTRVVLLRNLGPEDWVIALSLAVAVVLCVFSAQASPDALIPKGPPGGAPPGFGPPSFAPGGGPPGSGPPGGAPPGSGFPTGGPPSGNFSLGGPPTGFTPFGAGEIDLLKPQLAIFWAIPVYYATLTLTKLSILLQYIRIFFTKKMRYAIYGSLFITMVLSVFAIVSSVFLCSPFSFIESFRTGEGRCIPRVTIEVNAALNVATDILIVVLPLPGISNLNLPKTQKLAVMCIFGLAGFGCIVSVLRFGYLASLGADASAWDVNALTIVVIWSGIEVNVAIICACLPLLRPIAARIFPRFISSSEYARRTPRRFSRGGTLERGIHMKNRNVNKGFSETGGSSFATKNHDLESFHLDDDIKITATAARDSISRGYMQLEESGAEKSRIKVTTTIDRTAR